MRSTNVALAVLFARLVLGLIFLMAGVHKVFVMGPAGHVKAYFLPFADTCFCRPGRCGPSARRSRSSNC